MGARGHYERLLHERHWTVGHNTCKGPRRTLNGRLCSLVTTVADDTYYHTFRFCQHPLLCQARAESDALLPTAPFLTALDLLLFPALLRLVQEEDSVGITTLGLNAYGSRVVYKNQA